MSGFHEVRFPLRLALGATGGPVRRTDIVNLSNGREQRNQRWRDSRRSYDAGSGVKSFTDLYAVLEFFEARGGQLYGFRFRDPVDWKSCAPGEAVSATDQAIGTGDGETAAFQLVKIYADGAGSWVRRIVKPVAGTVALSVDGIAQAPEAFSGDAATGIVTFAAGHVPAIGAVVRAGYEFDVPVRFDTNRIDVNLAHFDAGRIPTIPLTEVLA
ncbi:TIGR02217 family protein [Neorhizobium galegae bv. orientalis]|nr:TIGR02217 family protein [Neorhizobium galegae bv. orientalis]